MATPTSEHSVDGAALVGVVVVSDRANAFKLLRSAGLEPGDTYEDRGGPAVMAYLEGAFSTPLEFEYRLIPDDRPRVVETLRELTDELGCSLIVTTGGTGPLTAGRHGRRDNRGLREAPARIRRGDAGRSP